MRAELKKIYSIEVPVTLKEYRPLDFENFGISIRLEVGLAGGDAKDLFDLFVCTPQWIKEQCNRTGAIWGRHMLLMPEYDFDRILQAMTRRIDSCQGGNWQEVANKFARFAAWEFEDYRPTPT